MIYTKTGDKVSQDNSGKLTHLLEEPGCPGIIPMGLREFRILMNNKKYL